MPQRIVDFDDPLQVSKVLGYFRTLKGKIRLEWCRMTKRRSDQQNKMLWSLIYPYVAAGLLEAWGEQLTDDEVHVYLKNKFLSKPIVNRQTGEVDAYTFPSSAKLDKAQFSEYVEKIMKFAAEDLHVEIPSPGELMREMA